MPDGKGHGSIGDARIQALQSALLLHPPSEDYKPTILSINPSIWGEPHHVINVGPLLGARPTMAGRPADLEHATAMAFHSVGWQLQRIEEEFRPDLKSPDRMDIALLGEDNQCLVAVEVKRNSGSEWQHRVREGWLFLERIAPNVAWHCVTDGTTFFLRNEVRGIRVELEHPFSPESLATGDFSSGPFGGSFAPASFTDLRQLLEDTRRIVLDHTLPLMRLEPNGKLRTMFEHELGSMPPVTDLTQALLAWIAQREGLRWISAFGAVSLLRGESSQWVRNELGSRFAVRTVIEFGGVFDDVHPAMRFCIIQLGKTRGAAFLTTVNGDTLEAFDERLRAAKQFFAGEKPEIGFTADVQATGRWGVSLYDPELNKLEQRLAGIGPTKPLSEVCTILRGLPLAQHSRSAKEGIPLVTRVAHVEKPASLPEDVRRVALTDERQRYLLRAGDIVVPAIRSNYSQCALVRSDVPLVASERLFILRVSDPGPTSEFLVEYLNSSLARRLIEERYAVSAGPMLTARSLGSLPVPMFGRPVTLGLWEIGAVETALRHRADELELQRQTLFDATSPQAFASAVQDLRRKGEVLSRSLLRADDMSFQVANFYPFPIAYGYRLLASISNPTDLYKEQLRVAENILAFVASVAMSLIQAADRATVGLDVRDVWDGGASPGHWRDIIAKCCKVLSTYKDHPLASSIVGLHIMTVKRGFGASIEKLITAKNDFKHDRGPRTEEDFESATKDVQQTLDACIKALAFFTEYPIRQVVDFDITRAGEVKLRCRSFVGDHPGLPQEEITYRTPLTKRDLYIAAAGVGWISLFPLLVARNCRTCKTRETFFLDKWNRKNGIAIRKSFERGHEEETNEVVSNMRGWLDSAPAD
jgi:hypothetical protein